MLKLLSVRFTLAAAAFCLLLSGCKEETLMGTNVIPGGDFLGGTFTDTLTLRTRTVREDSLQTHNRAKYVLGATQDGTFGKSYAGVYTQLRLSAFGVDFQDGASVDSAVLSLRYDGYYGDKTIPHSVRVFRLTEPVAYNEDSAIYSAQTFAHDGVAIGSKLNFIVNTDSSYKEGDTTYAPQLRIKLDNAFAQDILNQDPQGALKDNNAFQDYIKGLYIEADSTNPSKGMMYVALRNQQSMLTVYYTNPDSSKRKFRMFMDGSAVNSNYFKHSYAGSLAAAQLANDSVMFVHSMAGIKGRITIPHLFNLGNVIVNKAEIEITQRKNFPDDDIYPAPASMLVIAADSLGKNIGVIDQLYTASGLPTYGGSKQNVTVNGVEYTRYRMSIAGHLQRILNEQTTDYGLFLVNANSNVTADRAVIGGANRTDSYRMKLNLVYTKIP